MSQGEHSESSEAENYRSQRGKGKERTKNMRSEEGETPPLTKEEPGRVFRLAGRSRGKAGEMRSLWSSQQDQDSPWAEPLADQREKNTTAP